MNSMKYLFIGFLLLPFSDVFSQISVDTKAFSNLNGTEIKVSGKNLEVSWPVGNARRGELNLNLEQDKPLFQSVGLNKMIVRNLDPVFLLSVGKRELVAQKGWNIFFDKVPLKPHVTHAIKFKKNHAAVRTQGSRTIIVIDELQAPDFTGTLEITLYNGSALVNIAAVMTTQKDSTAILYDAGLMSKELSWKNISWSDVYGNMQSKNPEKTDTAISHEVKYRTIIGRGSGGSLAIFPPPHQYFYPLDEAFNLKFTWSGNNYRDLVDGYGIGIRQDLYGDNRYVPWFNAPPKTKQRLNFFFLLSDGDADEILSEVKKYTHNDSYVALPGYKTMSSHFHNEFIMNVVMKGEPVPDMPNFVKVFKKMGVDIVHLGEFHYTAHPQGPDDKRLAELAALFEQCERLSDDEFLLLPGEEPNEFFGGHWMQLFPKPVNWIMSRKADQPFVSTDPKYGKVYRIGNSSEMLELLKLENGLAWTAHPRTKGSTGYPDKYRDKEFYKSDRFLGAAWKPIPADLSLPRLGVRVLDLLDDMNNWGEEKRVIAEADLFTVEPENEMYAHMNVNYLQMDQLPRFNEGWLPVLDAMSEGKFFSTTGEVLLPTFEVEAKKDSVNITFQLNWTFPMNFAEIIWGDGVNVHRHHINLDTTQAFGNKTFSLTLERKGMKWVRVEAWDIAANGTFGQVVRLKE